MGKWKNYGAKRFKKTTKTKSESPTEASILDKFIEDLINSIVTNLKHNLQNPEKAALHEAEVEKVLDEVINDKSRKKKK
jgi:hypothetical protein